MEYKAMLVVAKRGSMVWRQPLETTTGGVSSRADEDAQASSTKAPATRTFKPRSGASFLPDSVLDIDVMELLRILPHRYPMLMIDRVEDYEPGKFLKTRKCVTYNEPFFTGHFPDQPIMPGVMILEAMAQAASLTAVVELTNVTVEGVKLASIDAARFRRPVFPGDVMIITSRHLRSKGRFHRFECIVEVDGQMVASAQIMALNVALGRITRSRSSSDSSDL